MRNSKRLHNTGCSLNIVFFPFCDFSELCQFCCSAGFVPAWCVYTHTDTKGKQRKTIVRNIRKSLEKNTIFNEHPVLAEEKLFRLGLQHKSSKKTFSL